MNDGIYQTGGMAIEDADARLARSKTCSASFWPRIATTEAMTSEILFGAVR
jgi:hypothetical protein